MSRVPHHDPQQQLAQVEASLQALDRLIHRQHRQMTQRKLAQQARAWGWEVITNGGKHPHKAIRSGYAPVVIPGHGGGDGIKPPVALKILHALTAPLRHHLETQAQHLQYQITQAQLHHLQDHQAWQTQRINELEAQVNDLRAEAEAGLALAIETEDQNKHLTQQIAALQHSRIDLVKTKQKVMVLIEERLELEAKMALFVADFERLEVALERVADFALDLPDHYRQQLLQIICQVTSH